MTPTKEHEMRTTTADKGELLPCPFCGEQPTQDDVGSYFVQCPECGVEGPYGSPDAEESAAIAAWNRRPTNEGQDGLTDADIDRLARPFVGMGGVEQHYEFTRAIARHLSSHPTPDDQQAKDAARYRKLRGMHWSDSMLCVVSEPKESVKIGCYCPSGEQLDAAIDAALSTTKQEEV